MWTRLWPLLVAATGADQDALLARAAAVDTFFATSGPAPAAWTVSAPGDVPPPWREIDTESFVKRIYRATVNGAPVVVKERVGEKAQASDTGGGTLYMELVYLAALRGRSGIPELYGAWFDEKCDIKKRL